jgi:hypothetical protein
MRVGTAAPCVRMAQIQACVSCQKGEWHQPLSQLHNRSDFETLV